MALTRRRSVSLPPELDRDVQEAAEADGLTVSDWISDALERGVRNFRLRQAVEQYERECGPIPQELKDEVDAKWPE
ncbi:hypothetical protein AYO38_08405 [bacterium SCGC AG-212-C10]|nr:hypothetical protein AYO38_08405 [bacterium SCGC AG-212-C10]